MLIVGNKSDLLSVDVNLADLKSRHCNVEEFFRLSAYKAFNEPNSPERARFTEFKNRLEDRLDELVGQGVSFSEDQYDALMESQRLAQDRDLIRKDEYREIFAKKGIGETRADQILRLLDQLGVVLHFPQLPRLDSFVLNPRWLTYGVYAVLYSERAQQLGGRLQESDIIEILKQATLRCEDEGEQRVLRYSESTAGHVIDAMLAFRTAFRGSDGRYVIPALLDFTARDDGFPRAEATAFSFKFSRLLLPHILPRLIVDRSAEIAEDGERVWRTGVLFDGEIVKRDAQALVTVDEIERRIELRVHGRDTQLYLTSLVDSMRKIMAETPDLDVDEELRLDPEMSRLDPGELPPSESVWAKWSTIETALRKGRDICTEGDYDYDLGLALQRAPISNAQLEADVFLSYTQADQERVRELDRRLKSQGIRCWWDRLLPDGKPFDREIEKRLNNVRAVVVLWSVNSIKSDWVRAEATKGRDRKICVGLLLDGFAGNETPAPFNVDQHIAFADDEKLLKRLIELGVRRR